MSIRTPICEILGIDHPIILGGMMGISEGEVYERPQIGDRHVCARASLLLCQSHLLDWRLVFHRLLRPCVLGITSPLIPLQRGTFGWRRHFGWRRCEGVCGWGSMG